MITTDRSREHRLRRMAKQRGLLLRKSRRRDPRALDYGYFIIEPHINGLLSSEFGMDLDEVEEWLTRDRVEEWLILEQAKERLIRSQASYRSNQ
ncbi:MAG: hypothetical protein ABR529_11715 [Actinomycetota bacterium]